MADICFNWLQDTGFDLLTDVNCSISDAWRFAVSLFYKHDYV